MRFKFLHITLLCIALSIFPKLNHAQFLQLGALENFTFYTIDGGVTNYGTSTITGNVGSNFGIISGFELPTLVAGTIENENAVTAQARIDLLNVYIHLYDLPVTQMHAPAFGGGESIAPGVYSITGAGSVGGTLILDGGGDIDAMFVIKIGGAMTVGAGAEVVLSNGTRACNVYWIAEGAVSMGASVIMKGTLIAHSGAASMGTGGDLEGRLLSFSGAITFGPGVATKPVCLSTILISCITSCINTTLGSAANFTLFTSEGAVANTGISGVIGDIGSHFGAVSGWEASVVIGNYYNADLVTMQADLDLKAAHTLLYNTPATSTTHTPAFGSGETLTPGVYEIAAAGSLAGEIILDGQNDPDAIFIFKFGAAFSVGANSQVTLINGARRCNIFWIAEGAISIAAFSIMKGNFIANNGAIDMGANGFLEGRLFSTKGAVGFNTSTGYISYSLCTAIVLPVDLTSLTVSCEDQQPVIKWSTASEINNSFFTIERSTDAINWQIAGTVAGSGSTSGQRNYTFNDAVEISANYYYRLKQTDTDNRFKYSNTIFVKNCENDSEGGLSVFPNPTSGRFTLSLQDDLRKVSSTEIFNAQGVRVYQSNIFKTNIDLSKQAAGIYLIRVVSDSKIITGKIIVE